MSRMVWLRVLLPYAAVVILCLLFLNWTLQLWQADFRTPFFNEEDALLTQLFVKNVMERGAYYRCERIAAPYGLDLRDFPLSESLHFGVMKLLALGTNSQYRVINYFYVLTFVFTALTSLFTFRQFGVAALPAVVAALLYAFMPYHFMRGEGHLFLSAYYMIPPLVLVALWIYLGKLSRQTETPSESWKIVGRRWGLTVLICALVSGAGVYYAFFGCFFLLVAGVARFLRGRRWTALLQAGTLILIIAVGVILIILPCLLYQHDQGRNPDVAHRAKWESEFYGLKLTHLLLPVKDHRLALFRRLKDHYALGGPWPTHEGCYCSALGTVGALGFVFLGFSFLFGRKLASQSRLVAGLGLLAVCGFLLATVGGLGSLFATYISPQIRCYNRMSIYLGFFALFAVALFLTWLLDQSRRWGRPGLAAASAFCVAVLAGGIWDQTTPAMVPHYAETKAAFASQKAFATQVEQRLPAGAMVWQLPFFEFPEASSPNNRNFGSYDQFRPYLVSHTLCWSHGTIKGRYGAWVQAQLAHKPLETLLEQAVLMGYGGIHVDRFAYADDGREVEAKLRSLLAQEPLVSPNGRDAFYNLMAYTEQLRSRYGEEQWTQRQEWYRHPVVGVWSSGADLDEGNGNRWCRSPAALTLVNSLPQTRTVTLRFQPAFPPQEGGKQPHLSVTSALLNGTVSIDTGGAPFSQVITVPPGKHTLRFESDGWRYRDEHARTLIFRVNNLEIVTEEPPSAPVAETVPAATPTEVDSDTP